MNFAFTLAVGVIAGMMTAVAAANAGQLVYHPVNPDFGGNPLNGTFLTSEATAQNTHVANSGSSSSTTTLTPQQQFANTITSSLLSQIAANIGNQILGENAAQSGTFLLDGTTISFSRASGQIVININDGTTGGTSTIQIPQPNY